MHHFTLPRASTAQRCLALTASALAASLLVACGGGDGDSDTPPITPIVSSVSTSSPHYGQTMTITILGANVNQPMSVTSPGCSDMTVSTTPPYVTTISTAYYQCRVSAVGAFTVTLSPIDSAGVIGSTSFAVPAPQVTMAVSNGLGVNGTMVITLAPDKTPVTVNNFLNYVNSGFYNNTIFHRTAPGFVVQGGGYGPLTPTTTPIAKTTNGPIGLEVGKGLSNLKYTIAMARGTGVDTATSQFFINLVDNVRLDTDGGGYAVFGNVSVGGAIVDAIAAAPCEVFPLLGLPVEDGSCTANPNVVVTSATQTQ